jgi:hypothetical protein
MVDPNGTELYLLFERFALERRASLPNFASPAVRKTTRPNSDARSLQTTSPRQERE